MNKRKFKVGDIVEYCQAPEGEFFLVKVTSTRHKERFSATVWDKSKFYENYQDYGTLYTSYCYDYYNLHETLNLSNTDLLFDELFSSFDNMEQKLKQNGNS